MSFLFIDLDFKVLNEHNQCTEFMYVSLKTAYDHIICPWNCYSVKIYKKCLKFSQFLHD